MNQCKNCKISTNNNKFCSKKCSGFYQRINKTLICSYCKIIYIRKPWQIRKTKINYCCQKCHYKDKAKILVSCHKCKNQVFIYQSRARYYSQYYCNNKCRLLEKQEWLIGSKKKFNNYYNKFIRSLRCTAKYLLWKTNCLSRDKYQCQNCKRKSQLTVHHIFTMGQFVAKHKLNREAIMNDTLFLDQNNGITLCRSCHLKQHSGEKHVKNTKH